MIKEKDEDESFVLDDGLILIPLRAQSIEAFSL